MECSVRAYRPAALIMSIALTGAAPPTPPAVPICGSDELKLAGGAVADVDIFVRELTTVELKFPLPTSVLKGTRFRFDKEPELRLRYRWPKDESSEPPIIHWGNLTDHGRPADGIVQFECGRRNMGLMNFELWDGRPLIDHERREDAMDCLGELDEDGKYRISIDQDAVVHVLTVGRVELTAARLQVRNYIERELEREESGLCKIREIPLVF
jgi:hypothetical protein